MFKPVITVVGRPNVGKSTLFNRLTRTRDAIVADMPGLTRDRHYGHGKVGEMPYYIVDTGGFEPVVDSGILHAMAQQSEQAIIEADAVIFLVDARQGLTPQDEILADKLRKYSVNKPVFLAVNKGEGMPYSGSDFFSLGLGDPMVISAAHGDGIRELVDLALAPFLPAYQLELESDEQKAIQAQELKEKEEKQGVPFDHKTQQVDIKAGLKIAIVGRPNVGKSTLINTLIGENRVIAFDEAGTTRDSIYVPFSRGGNDYVLIDTAGIRKRGKVFEAIEKFSVIKTMQAIDDAHVVILMLDATQDVADQDAHIAQYILESGRALVVAINKWDGLPEYTRQRTKLDLERKLQFLNFARFHFVSALKNQGLNHVMKSIHEAFAAASCKLSTPRINNILRAAVEKQAPPRNGIFRPKLRYAHQGGMNPPTIVVHGNALDEISNSYKRFLEGQFRTGFELMGTPLRIEWRTSHNPFAEKEEKFTKKENIQRRESYHKNALKARGKR